MIPDWDEEEDGASVLAAKTADLLGEEAAEGNALPSSAAVHGMAGGSSTGSGSSKQPPSGGKHNKRVGKIQCRGCRKSFDVAIMGYQHHVLPDCVQEVVGPHLLSCSRAGHGCAGVAVTHAAGPRC
eukprot:10599769-Lingulodinium_polyedra.AAC.1